MNVTKSIQAYLRAQQRPLDFFINSTTISINELTENVQNLKQSPNLKNLASITRTLFNSSTWISNSFLRLLHSILQAPEKKKYLGQSKKDLFIAVEHGERIDVFLEYPEILFEMVFREREYLQLNKHKKPLINMPVVNETLVLVSGVFNEFFSTPAFERGAAYLAKTYGIKYFSPNVSGNKSSEYNATLLYEQIDEYHRNHPDEKLWFFAFSKGGIDCLHFLVNHADYASEFITSLTTIATPIQGSTHFNNKILGLIRKLEHLPHYDKLNEILDNKLSIEKELRESLSKDVRESWFENNKHKLPKEFFYSALGLHAKWHESHFWMIFMKMLIQSSSNNDGVVDTEDSLYPKDFNAYNLGVINGHHLIGTRSSYFNQEALLEALIITTNYLKRFERVPLSNSSKLAC